jgi:hypothetical protein
MKKIIKKISRILPDKLYLSLKYRYIFGSFPDLKNPKKFNEKMQWLKLHDRKPIYTTMVDKYEVKKYVADILGEEYVIPTYGVWDKFEDIDFDALPDQFVLKCTHDSGGLVVCRDKSKLNKEEAKKKINKSLKNNYYFHNREWPYKDVKPRIIAEKFLASSDGTVLDTSKSSVTCEELQKMHGLLDYKFMCCDGVVKAMLLDIGIIGSGTGHAEKYYRNVYDRDGNLLPMRETRENYPIAVELPSNLQKMIEIAEKLSAGFTFLRVDLYSLDNGEIKLGEITFYHGGGMSNVFIPEEWDSIFGSWIKLPEKTT